MEDDLDDNSFEIGYQLAKMQNATGADLGLVFVLGTGFGILMTLLVYVVVVL